MQSVETLAAEVGVQTACEALAVPRSSLYATRRPPPEVAPRPVPPPPNALTALEKTAVLAELNSERFADQTPYEVYPHLLDEGRYLCSLRGMYRILAENQAVRDRRDQLRHPARPAPQVSARQPNRVWVWDITLLLSTVRYQCFYLYRVLDLPQESLHRRLAHRREAKRRLRRAPARRQPPTLPTPARAIDRALRQWRADDGQTPRLALR
jgi:putative transposase